MDPNDKKIEEVAKAVAETAKFGTQGVKTTEKILGFVARVFQEPAIEVAGIIGDRLKFFRWQRQLAYVDKVNIILDSRGIENTRAVMPKLALPILENASLEDDDELQKLWANLMANAMDPNFTTDLRMSFIDIIKSLTPLDVKLLKSFYDILKSDSSVDWDNILHYSLKKEQICEMLKISSHDYEVSVFNLFRTQCIAPALLETSGIKFGNESTTIYKGSKAITITPLGVDFIESCVK